MPRRIRLLRKIDERAPVDRLCGDEDIQRLDRNVQQFAVIDLVALGKAFHQHVAATRHRYLVAGKQSGFGGDRDDLAIAHYALDEDALAVGKRLGLGNRLVGGEAFFLDAVAAQFVLAPCRSQSAGLGSACRHLLFIAGALGGNVDPEDLRAKERQYPAGSDRAEKIGDRIGDRYEVQLRLGFLGRHSRCVDRIGGEADRGGNGLRTRQKPGGKSRPVARHDRGDVDPQQAEHGHHHREQGLRQAVRRDAAHELGPDAEADGKQEHDEEDRLHLTGNLDSDLADDDARQKRAGHRAKAEAAKSFALRSSSRSPSVMKIASCGLARRVSTI